jgi:hypothetical protein
VRYNKYGKEINEYKDSIDKIQESRQHGILRRRYDDNIKTDLTEILYGYVD